MEFWKQKLNNEIQRLESVLSLIEHRIRLSLVYDLGHGKKTRKSFKENSGNKSAYIRIMN